MHPGAAGRTREERVRQVIEGEKSVNDFAAYIPVDNAVGKLQAWRKQGAEIVYLSSHKGIEEVEMDKAILGKHAFPGDEVFFRQGDEQYSDVAERVLPDILIEDDCESIGGEKETTYPHIKPAIKEKIKSIVVKEFEGLDHLPEDISTLMNR